MNKLDDFMEYLYVTGQVDENFGLKPTCPSCGQPLEKTNNPEYPYYCPSCGKKFDENLNEKEQGYTKRRTW